MFEWRIRSRHAGWLSAAIVALAGFAGCSGGRSSTAPTPQAARPAPLPAPSSRTTQTVPGNAGNAANITPPHTQQA
jgi:hypothetical protein